MAKEHMKSWAVGDVTVTRVVELWDFQDNIQMTMPDATAEEVIALDWLHPHYATPDGKQRMNFQGFVVQAPGRVIVVDSCIGAGRQRDFDVFCDLPEGFLEDLESLGITEASATRSPLMPITRSCGSTTAPASEPIRQVPTG